MLLTAARDADGTVVDFVYAFANDAACAVNGVTREELIGRRLLEFPPESWTAGLFDAFVRVVETGEPFIQDDLVFAVGGDGEQTERHLDIRVTRVGDQVTSAPIIDAAFERLVAEGEPQDLELGLIRAADRRIWVRQDRLGGDRGRLRRARVGGNIADVTDHMQAEEEIRTLNAELEQRVATRTGSWSGSIGA